MDHHNYSLDKDTVENIQQLLNQNPKAVFRGNHGLPADEHLNDYQETDESIELDQETEAPIYGLGASRPAPNEFRKQK